MIIMLQCMLTYTAFFPLLQYMSSDSETEGGVSVFSAIEQPSFASSSLTSQECFENEFCLKESRENIFSSLSLVRKITCTFTLKLTDFTVHVSHKTLPQCQNAAQQCLSHTCTPFSHTTTNTTLQRRRAILPYPIY